MVTTGKDITVILEDRPGTLAKACEAIAKAGINIDGHCGFPSGGEGVFHVLTKDPTATRRAVEGAGFKVRGERDVVVTDAEDRPGTLARFFRGIADTGVNVDLTYISTNNRVVVGGDNLAKIREALEKVAAAPTRR